MLAGLPRLKYQCQHVPPAHTMYAADNTENTDTPVDKIRDTFINNQGCL